MKNKNKARAHDARRNTLLARVHIARKALNLDEETYRAMILNGWGQTSAGKLPERELQALCTALEREAGTGRFAPKPARQKGGSSYPGRPNNIGVREAQTPGGPPAETSRSRQLRKIEALLTEARRPWSYADALALRICKVDKVAFVPERNLYKIITALNKDAERHGRATG